MKILGVSSEDEMIYQFLHMEIQSERYNEKITDILNELHLDSNIIYHGHIDNEQENALRRCILTHFRGYGDKTELFQNYPDKVDWYWTAFNEEDLGKIVYINYSYWNEISAYTGSPLAAAKIIRAGKRIFDVPNNGFWEAADYIKRGFKFPPLIMLTDRKESRFILLEGHKRTTAYALAPEYFKDVSVLLGYCEDIDLFQKVIAAPN